MKNFLVIGNPIEHSISPKLHNYWFKETKIDAIYQKQQLEENQLSEFINRIREIYCFSKQQTINKIGEK